MPAVKRPRHSFTFDYKLRVITLADEIGNRAAAREFEIDESMIRYWRKKKAMAKLPKRQRTCRTGIAKKNSRAVTTVMIRLKARELAKQMNVADFVGGPS
ncbi:unnamed protein product [Pocillopora meandrina]|uniref:HTH psq-type domain-containing protein n=1 Tax=Pocillopora meandrina TaxID=46732 RepID=A0AAU9WJA2_9CNID|nr:unnamed protein product [Pocillopora meandrina]